MTLGVPAQSFLVDDSELGVAPAQSQRSSHLSSRYEGVSNLLRRRTINQQRPPSATDSGRYRETPIELAAGPSRANRAEGRSRELTYSPSEMPTQIGTT